MENSRKRTRVEGHFHGRLEAPGVSLTMTTENISLKGVLCDLDNPAAPLEQGQNITVILPLSAEVELSIQATVVRHQDKQVAVDFLGMDEESYTHLRNIVRFSSRDPDAIDKEQAVKPFLNEE